MRVHVIDGGTAGALGAALEATPFSDELKEQLWRELLDSARFPRSDHGVFDCENVSALPACDEIVGFRRGDLIARFGVGLAGKLLTSAFGALGRLAPEQHVAHDASLLGLSGDA
jgi:hypothetical protein